MRQTKIEMVFTLSINSVTETKVKWELISAISKWYAAIYENFYSILLCVYLNKAKIYIVEQNIKKPIQFTPNESLDITFLREKFKRKTRAFWAKQNTCVLRISYNRNYESIPNDFIWNILCCNCQLRTL